MIIRNVTSIVVKVFLHEVFERLSLKMVKDDVEVILASQKLVTFVDIRMHQFFENLG